MPLRDIKPLFVVATRGGTTVFLPLVLWRHNWKSAWQRLLVPVGHSDFDYHDPIIAGCDDSCAIAISFWHALQDYLTRVQRLRFDHLVIDGVRSNATGDGKGWTTDESSPWTDLTQFTHQDEFLPSLPSRMRKDVRRSLRRSEEAGGLNKVTYGTHQTAEVLHELTAFLGAHSRRWPNAYKAPHFHENLVRYGLPAGIVLFRTIRVAGDVAAWGLAFHFRKRYYAYMSAMVDRFIHVSPGKILMLYRYEQAITNGDEIFDHLRGTEEYKADWAAETQVLSRFEMRTGRLGASIRNALVDHIKPLLAKRG